MIGILLLLLGDERSMCRTKASVGEQECVKFAVYPNQEFADQKWKFPLDLQQ